MKLKSKEQIAAHVATFPGLTAERKAEIADHLSHLPDSHHDAVRAVLVREDGDPETRFVRGCFAEPAEAAKTVPAATEPEDYEPGEHPGYPTAA